MGEISRREFCAGMAGAAALAAVPLKAAEPKSPASAAGKRPNVVFVLADDLGWGDLSCYGHDAIATPALDKLAGQGVRFTSFYAAGPVCSPSRAGIMTGRFPSRHRIFDFISNSQRNSNRDMPDWLDPTVTTMLRLFQRAGYRTGQFGKWHLGSGADAPEPDAYGADEFRVMLNRGRGWDAPDFDSRSSELIVDEAIRFIEASREKPFFVNVWLKDVHALLDPTDQQMAAYKDKRGALLVYYSAVTNMDRHIGRLLSKLDELDLTDDTIVIFTSDNGPEDIVIPNAATSGVGSPGPFRGRKRSLYEGGIRVPFIVRWPGKTPAGGVDDTTVLAGIDMLPTLCAAAGVPVPSELKLDGEDLSASLGGAPASRSGPLFWDYRQGVAGHVINRSPMLATRDGNWKLLANPDGGRIELYDIPADPSELHNVAAENPEIAQRMKERLLKHYASLPPGAVNPEAGKAEYPWPGSAVD